MTSSLKRHQGKMAILLLVGLVVFATVNLKGYSSNQQLEGVGFVRSMSLFIPLTEQKKEETREERLYHPSAVVDTLPPHPRPLLNPFFLEGIDPSTIIPAHDMDAVVMATRPDATLAMSIHNLYHLNGFRRFIFFVNEKKSCPEIFDLMPQHNPLNMNTDDAVHHHDESATTANKGPHLCFEHTAFYAPEVIDHLWTAYPILKRGDRRPYGNKYVYVSRLGWYLQQFTKYLVGIRASSDAAAYTSSLESDAFSLVPDLSENYLAIDGDVIFTRPYKFVDDDDSIALPTKAERSNMWEWFVKQILGEEVLEENKKDATIRGNYVIGWMVFKRNIVSDLVKIIDDKLGGSGKNKTTFPLNVMDTAERNMKENDTSFASNVWFSEFFTYGIYALSRTDNPYRIVSIGAQDRNVGMREKLMTCVLDKDMYDFSRNNTAKAPFLIWEEHKLITTDSCLEGNDTTFLKEVGIWHDFHPPPWGGGNQFLLALRYGLEKYGVQVVAKNDVNGIERIKTTTQVLLANAVTFAGNMEILDEKKKEQNLALVHRVDGPYHVARYDREPNVSVTTIPLEDQQTENINKKYACATVFQSKWSMDVNYNIGLDLKNPILVPNTVNPTVFYPKNTSSSFKGRRIRIIASSHSAGTRKGFDTMLWMDKNLDFQKYDFIYVGGVPKEGFEPTNIHIIKELPSDGVSDMLRDADIYFAPSRNEPASNAVMEALASGLPVLFQEGSSHRELVGGGGIGFTTLGPNILEALEELVKDYRHYTSKIRVPSIDDVSRQYISILRWCFYMRHVFL